MSGSGMTSVPGGFRKRTLKTVKLFTKAGLGAAKRNLTGGKSSKAVDDGAALLAAERLVDDLSKLKGLVMKLGQMASYLDHSLPPDAQRVLAKLQSQSEPMAFEVVAKVVREELGDEPEVLFEGFEREPFAAASIGQVHRAYLDGRPVAVKVQYPGVIEAMDSDLKTLGRFARIGFMFSSLDSKELVAELRARILEECDYELEARGQQLFSELFASDRDRSVPPVVFERSSRRVLTSAYDPGKSFRQFVEEATQEQRDRAGAVLFRSSFQSIFEYGVFNADPHPGNFLFGDDGSVTFLDFGCLKWFDASFIGRWKALARSLLDGDRASFPERFSAVGMVGKPKGFDWDYQWEVMRFLYQPFRVHEPSVYTAEFLGELNRRMTFANPNRLKISLPRDWLLVNRIQFGLLSVLVRLGARNDWAALFRSALEAELRPPRLASGAAP